MQKVDTFSIFLFGVHISGEGILYVCLRPSFFSLKGFMNIYLSAAYHRKAEIAGYAKRIANETQHAIVSRWLVQRNQPDRKTSERVLAKRAKEDLKDERRCRIYVRFSDPEFFGKKLVTSHLLSGARMVEMGVALERKMRCIVVGGRQAVFDRLSNVEHVANVDELILRLRKKCE